LEGVRALLRNESKCELISTNAKTQEAIIEKFTRKIIIKCAGFWALFLAAMLLWGLPLRAVEKKTFEYEIEGKKERGEYVLGSRLYPIPKVRKPEKLKPLMDPTFHIKITRMTDKQIDGYQKKWKSMKNEYAKADPENCDGSYVVLTMGEYYWLIYETKNWTIFRHLNKYDGGKIKPGAIEPRWHVEDPNILYYRLGRALYRYKVREGKSEVVHDFTKYIPDAESKRAWIATKTEGTPSYDCRYWAFTVARAGPCMLCYDMKENKVVSKLMEPAGDSISMSPSGKWVFTARGTTRYKRDFAEPLKLCPYHRMNHGDIAIDAEGNEVFIHQCPDDWITMYDFKTGKTTRLISMIHDSNWKDYTWKTPEGKRLIKSFHISGNCYATPGWVLISTTGEGGRVARNWQAKSLYMLELKGNPRIWRIAHTHCISRNYRESVFATINTRGTRIYFGSNWDNPGDGIETYIAELPVNWYEDLMGNEKARELREKAARLLGTTVEELVGKKE
jgi:hypothetical protein